MEVSIPYGDFETLKGHIDEIKDFVEGGQFGHGLSNEELCLKIIELAKTDSPDLAHLAYTLNGLVDDWREMMRGA